MERLNEGEHMSEVKLAGSLIGKTGIQSVVKPLQVRRNPGWQHPPLFSACCASEPSDIR